MATARLFNLARMTTATSGTGTITLGTAVSAHVTFANAGVTDGMIVTYAIADGTSSEVGRGVYTASGTTLTRGCITSTNSNNAISLSGTAEVFITAIAEDINIMGNMSTGTSYLVWTAGANGGFLREVRIKANPANNTAATVVRLWVNNNLTTATAANNSIITEVGLPATTASNSVALPDFIISLNMAINATYRIYLTLGTAPGGSGAFTATGIGGNY